jgi:hypothetical protein
LIPRKLRTLLAIWEQQRTGLAGFFEDANIEPGQQNEIMPETSPKILSGQKPTTFQHCLILTTAGISIGG